MSILGVKTSFKSRMEKIMPKRLSIESRIDEWVADVYFCATFCTEKATAVLMSKRYATAQALLAVTACSGGSMTSASTKAITPAKTSCKMDNCSGSNRRT